MTHIDSLTPIYVSTQSGVNVFFSLQLLGCFVLSPAAYRCVEEGDGLVSFNVFVMHLKFFADLLQPLSSCCLNAQTKRKPSSTDFMGSSHRYLTTVRQARLASSAASRSQAATDPHPQPLATEASD